MLINSATGAIPSFKNQKKAPIHKALKNYYSENYGLKDVFSNAYIDFKVNTLNENPIPHKLIKGKNEWYFLGNSYNNTLDNAFGHDNLTTKELQKITSKIKEVKTYLNSKGIAFYFMVAPDKNQIYKEFLPYQLEQKPTKLDVLKKHLKETLNIDIIDFKDMLLASKGTDIPLYIKSDTHWNDYGAYLSYVYALEIMNKDIEIPIVPLSEFNLEKELRDFDITRMINVKNKDSAFVLNKKTASLVQSKNTDAYYRHYSNSERNLKIMIHGDSFFNALTKFFNESFGESIYVRPYQIPEAYIEKEMPDIVIFEIAERNIEFLAQ